jgi:hypothetical protein
MAELSEEHHRCLQVVKENTKDLAEFLQGIQVMDHFPSINYNDIKWAIATVTHLEEISKRSVTIAERTMLATRWIWEAEHYTHAMEYVKVKSIQEYLTGVAACRSFQGFSTSLQTAGDLENAGYFPSVMQGNGGAWKAQQSLVQTAGDLENAGYSSSVLQGPGGSWKAQQSLVQTVGDQGNISFSLLVNL